MKMNNERQSRLVLWLLVAGLLLGLVAHDADGDTIWVDWTYTLPDANGTEAKPFETINAGIVNALSGDTVQVKPGVYEENVFIDNHLTLLGTGPDTTVIKGLTDNAITIEANYNVTIKNFTVTGAVSGILVNECSSEVSIVLKNIVAVANASYGFYQSSGCDAAVAGTNCTFAGNGTSGVKANNRSVFTNCIATTNASRGFLGQGYNNYVAVRYSNSWNNISNYQDVSSANNLDPVDPEYVDADTGDYRLLSTSPCRNAGTPDQADRNPDGSRNDMGAYGGPGAAGFYDGYGTGPVVTDLHVTPGSVPQGDTVNITATGTAL